MDVAGIKYDGVLDGDSIPGLFSGKEPRALQERPLFWHVASQLHNGTCSVIRKNDLKLIQFLKDGALELYDLSKDPAEAHNLAAEKPETVQQLRKQLATGGKSIRSHCRRNRRWRTDVYSSQSPKAALL